MYVYVCICTYIYIYACISLSIYIYRERERNMFSCLGWRPARRAQSTEHMDSLRGSSVKHETKLRRLARLWRKDDTHTSRSVNMFFKHTIQQKHKAQNTDRRAQSAEQRTRCSAAKLSTVPHTPNLPTENLPTSSLRQVVPPESRARTTSSDSSGFRCTVLEVGGQANVRPQSPY